MDKLSQRLKQVMTVAKRGPMEENELSSVMYDKPGVSRFQYPSENSDMACDPLLMDEILCSIEEPYYCDSDVSLFELLKLNESANISTLRTRCQQLEKQNRTVCRRVSQLVLEKQPSYEGELKRVLQLQESNSDALRQCRFVRESLMVMKEGLIYSRAHVVSNFRKRKKLEEVLSFLGRIRTLQQTVFQLKDLIESEDYFSALELLRECQEVVQDYRYFDCVNKLNHRLKSIQMQINEGLDRGLYNMCEDFNKVTYDALQRAFTLLESTHASVNQLQMHYTTALHRRTNKIVLGFVQLTADAGEKKGDLEALPYTELCQLVPGDLLIPCITTLCKGLWQILHCYHQTTLWHREAMETGSQVNSQENTDSKPVNHQSDNDSTRPVISDSNSTSSNLTINVVLSADYILSKLEAGRVRMWNDVMEKVMPLIHSMSHANYKFDEVLRVLLIVNRLVQVGEVFCNSRSEPLQEALRDQMIAFFTHFHRENLERLRMFLENESWEMCAVRSTFTILDLLEFRPFRRELSSILSGRVHSKKPLLDLSKVSGTPVASNGISDDSISNVSVPGVAEGGTSPASSSRGNATQQTYASSDLSQFFTEQLNKPPPRNPFDVPLLDENATTEDFMEEELDLGDTDIRVDVTKHFLSDDSDEDGEHHGSALSRELGMPTRRSIQRRSSQKGRNRPFLANTTLELFRLMGRYLQMMHLLKPISLEVTKGVCQLFEYYFYSIYHLFVTQKMDCVQHLFTTRLRNCVKRIEDRLVKTNESLTSMDGKVPLPILNNIHFPQSLSGELSVRLVSMESLLYVGDLLYHHIVPYVRDQLLLRNSSDNSSMEALMVASNSYESQSRALLHVLHHESLPAAWDLRQPAFQVAVLRLLPYERIPQRIVTVNWNSKEISSQCSTYVIEVNQMLDQVAQCFLELQTTRGVPIPLNSEETLWQLLLLHISRWWVDGLAQVTSCTQEGRALMLMDLQHYAMKAETLCRSKPIPGKETIEQYIKAFYVPQQEMEEWVISRKQMFTRRQLTNLVQCVVRERKLKQNMLQTLTQSPPGAFLSEAIYGR